MTDQTEGKTEEGLKWGEWVYISLGFLLVGFRRRTQYITSIGLFYKEVGIYDIVVSIWLGGILGGVLRGVCIYEELLGFTNRGW